MKITDFINKLLLITLTLLLPGLTLAHSGEHHSSVLFNILHSLSGADYIQIISHPTSLVAAAIAGVCLALASVS